MRVVDWAEGDGYGKQQCVNYFALFLAATYRLTVANVGSEHGHLIEGHDQRGEYGGENVVNFFTE